MGKQAAEGRVQVYAVVRLDLFLSMADLEGQVTVKEVLPTIEQAEAEVQRLNALRGEPDKIRYFWQATRYYPAGRQGALGLD